MVRLEPSDVPVTLENTMKTATHDGHCQVCGRLQRLPGGTLAKHGYEVHGRNNGYGGYFSGQCWGSHAQPFEESCELVKLSIERATVERDRTLVKQEELRQPATEPTGPVSVYFKSRYFGRGYYAWVDGKVEQKADSEYFNIIYEGETDSGEKKTVRRSAFEIVGYYGMKNDPLEIASAMRRNYADALTKAVAELNEYIDAQQMRVNGWKPAPLIKRK
jgi:hypothetical protein